ncbi:hypothetical protein ACW9HR_03520 [Nocardia gipuzkoensis]
MVVTGLLDTLLYILHAWYEEQAHCWPTGWAAALADQSHLRRAAPYERRSGAFLDRSRSGPGGPNSPHTTV